MNDIDLRPYAWPRVGAILLALCATTLSWGQAPSGGSLIYSCNDASGKKITRDRPIPECTAREQRVLNADGSLNRIMPPTMTAEEAAVAEARLHDIEIEHNRQREAEKRDRNLLARFPSEAAHRKARELALEDVRQSLRTSEQRLAALAKERKPLTDESEFYVGKSLPFKLKLALDANDASVDAQQSLMQNQKLEIVRIDKIFDDELVHLRLLWAGARPGVMGPYAAASASSTSAGRP